MRLWSLIVLSDTTPTRFMLALAASFWAIMLWLPGETFARPVYYYMAQAASERVWALFWSMHAIGMYWRIFTNRHSIAAAMFINILGVCLFGSAATSIFLTLTFPIPAAIAPDIVLALAAFWCLVRTGVSSESGWRGD